ncbi:MAG: hypothetical protein PHT12_02630 [Patescibacteria group bacterium]|nr:hypothetical protein [Patescibacteria group bacterium]
MPKGVKAALLLGALAAIALAYVYGYGQLTKRLQTSKPPAEANQPNQQTDNELKAQTIIYVGAVADTVAPTIRDLYDFGMKIQNAHELKDTATAEDMAKLVRRTCTTALNADVAAQLAMVQSQPVSVTRFSATTAKLTTAIGNFQKFCANAALTSYDADVVNLGKDEYLPYVASLIEVGTTLDTDYAALTAATPKIDWKDVEPWYENASRLMK